MFAEMPSLRGKVSHSLWFKEPPDNSSQLLLMPLWVQEALPVQKSSSERKESISGLQTSSVPRFPNVVNCICPLPTGVCMVCHPHLCPLGVWGNAGKDQEVPHSGVETEGSDSLCTAGSGKHFEGLRLSLRLLPTGAEKLGQLGKGASFHHTTPWIAKEQPRKSSMSWAHPPVWAAGRERILPSTLLL